MPPCSRLGSHENASTSPSRFLPRKLLGVAVDVLGRDGHELIVSDLYAEGFDPLLAKGELGGGASRSADVKREQRRVAWADSLVFFYPVWWYDRPAILKGWCDRVLEPGFAYGYDAETRTTFGLLGGKRATVIATFAAREEDIDTDQVTRGFTQGTLGFCGVEDVDDLSLFAVPRVDPPSRARMLQRVRDLLTERHVVEMESR